MPDEKQRRPGLDNFWEQADDDASDEHPLERELGDRLDALARYRRRISDLCTEGRDEEADLLQHEHDREVSEVRRLRRAIRRMEKKDEDA